ncbi:MAG: 50S ribosomal protein L19 [Patescibacteria group bacterium]
MSNLLLRKSKVVTANIKTDLPEFKVGSRVDVYYKIKEGNKERVQVFSGLVTNIHGKSNIDTTFTVLKVATGSIKVERTFPLHSPLIDKLVVTSFNRARKANLRYLHNLKDPIKQVRAKKVKLVEAL